MRMLKNLIEQKEKIPVGRWNGVPFLEIKKCAALQVRCKSLSKMKKEKAFCSVSQSGSVTVEAALGFTLFLLAIVSFMLPIRIVDIQRQVQAVLESVNEELCQYAYGIETEETKGKTFLYSAAGTYIKRKMIEQVKDVNMENVSTLGTKILEDGESIDLRVSYSLNIPFPAKNMSKITLHARSYRRAWIGKSGLSEKKENGKNDLTDQEKTGDIVYIGNTSSRYHLYADCRYLFHDIEEVTYDSVKERRNRFGQKYQPCEVCQNMPEGEVVYIMSGGEKYHNSRTCSSIQAFVQEIPLEEIKDLGVCSYCEKRREK